MLYSSVTALAASWQKGLSLIDCRQLKVIAALRLFPDCIPILFADCDFQKNRQGGLDDGNVEMKICICALLSPRAARYVGAYCIVLLSRLFVPRLEREKKVTDGSRGTRQSTVLGPRAMTSELVSDSV